MKSGRWKVTLRARVGLARRGRRARAPSRPCAARACSCQRRASPVDAREADVKAAPCGCTARSRPRPGRCAGTTSSCRAFILAQASSAGSQLPSQEGLRRGAQVGLATRLRRDRRRGRGGGEQDCAHRARCPRRRPRGRARPSSAASPRRPRRRRSGASASRRPRARRGPRRTSGRPGCSPGRAPRSSSAARGSRCTSGLRSVSGASHHGPWLR